VTGNTSDIDDDALPVADASQACVDPIDADRVDINADHLEPTAAIGGPSLPEPHDSNPRTGISIAKDTTRRITRCR
jgi:hypothetical protein